MGKHGNSIVNTLVIIILVSAVFLVLLAIFKKIIAMGRGGII